MRPHHTALLLLATASVGIGACGSTDPEPVEAAACAYEFEANVRQGPSAPFQTRGLLVVATDSAGAAAGVYRPVDAATVDDLLVPDVTIADGTIGLGFHTPGGVVEGSGALTGDGGCVDTLLGDLSGPTDGDAGDWDGVLIDGERVELHTVERHPAPVAGAAATEVAIGTIDIGPEPEPTRDPELDPSSLDTFDSLPRVNELGNTLVDAAVDGTLERRSFYPPLRLDDPVPSGRIEEGCPEPEDLGDGECIQ